MLVMELPVAQEVRYEIESPYIFDMASADVTGDHVPDYIYLGGTKEEDSVFEDNLMLYIVDGKTEKVEKRTLPIRGGYGASLFLGDFTKDCIADIFISVSTGGSGGIYDYYVYRAKKHDVELLFDANDFFENQSWSVTFKDDYIVDITNNKEKMTYPLAVLQDDNNYINVLYDESGKLKEPTTGYVSPFGGLYPTKRQTDDCYYELRGLSRIVGVANAHTVGLLEVQFEFQGDRFVPTQQIVGYIEFLTR